MCELRPSLPMNLCTTQVCVPVSDEGLRAGVGVGIQLERSGSVGHGLMASCWVGDCLQKQWRSCHPQSFWENMGFCQTVWAMPNFVRPQWHLVSEMLCRLCSHTRHLVWDSVPRALWAGTGPWWSLLTAKPETLKQQPLGFHKCIVPVCLPTHLSQENLSGLKASS